MGGLILVSAAAGIISCVASGILYSWLKAKTKNKLLRFLSYILCVIVGLVAGIIAGSIVISIARGLPENTLSVLIQTALLFALPCPLFDRLRK